MSTWCIYLGTFQALLITVNRLKEEEYIMPACPVQRRIVIASAEFGGNKRGHEIGVCQPVVVYREVTTCHQINVLSDMIDLFHS